MKLLHSITRKYIVSAVSVLILFTVAMYVLVNTILDSSINEQLMGTKGRIVSNYPGGSLKVFPFIEIDEVASIPPHTADMLKDTLIYNTAEHEQEVFREYVSYQELHHSPHKITLRLSLIEKEDLIWAFSAAFGLFSALLLLALFIVNKKTTAALFAPFYRTLAQMRNFSLRSSVPLALENGDIDEFKELNTILSELTARARKEYTAVKEFSENASHELQTPLAIVTSKLDLLIQKENLDDEEKLLIEAMYLNIGRLTHLNKALLLLSQIETAGYFEPADVDFAREVRSELDAMMPIAEYKNITVTSSIEPMRPVTANPMLVHILVKNLLSNALKHNHDGGTIAVRAEENSFVIENTGAAPESGTEILFDRFQKSGASDDSIGLGLAVVKEICTLYHFGVEYVYAGGMHTVTVRLTGIHQSN